MKLCQVIIDIPTVALDMPYTYRVPDRSDAKIGCAVVVPFGRRRAIGFIIDLFDDKEAPLKGIELPDFAKIKPYFEIASSSYFDENGAACAQYLAKRYVAPLSTCIRLFTPPGGVPKAVMRGGHWIIESPAVGEVDDRWVTRGPEYGTFVPKKNAVKQIAILESISQGDIRITELTCEYGALSSSITALEKAGAVRVEHRRRMRGMDDITENKQLTKKLTLNDDQQKALDIIKTAVEESKGSVIVLDGVTGSGKTEVYLQAIEHVISQGKTACVLVPEISLTPQTVGRFRGRFGNLVAVMHSRMSMGERYDQWDFVKSGQARVVVGARSALFTPLENLGIIVIDEEHEGSYKQDSAPRYVSRDVAAWMALQHNATVVLGSATPSIDTLYRCETDDRYTLVSLKKRANGKAMPKIHVVDMAKEFSSGHRSMFARDLIEALKTELALGHKAVLLLNQRGFAKFVLCRDCGYVPQCPQCTTSLTYHERGDVLMCHHCGYQKTLPARCPECNSPYLKKFGAGTQRVEDELVALISSMDAPANTARVIRMDADTTKQKGAHQKLLEEFALPGAAVLLGTQMIAKGLDFPDVTVVGMINVDTTLNLPDFRAAERTFALMEQVAGRAGRADLGGAVYAQTYHADAKAIQAAAAYNREALLDEELHKRQMLGYPPFVSMGNVLIWGRNEDEVRKEAIELHEALLSFNDGTFEILEATPCALERLRQNYRWHILIKKAANKTNQNGNETSASAEIAKLCETILRKRKTKESVSVSIDIDPENLF